MSWIHLNDHNQNDTPIMEYVTCLNCGGLAKDHSTTSFPAGRCLFVPGGLTYDARLGCSSIILEDAIAYQDFWERARQWKFK